MISVCTVTLNRLEILKQSLPDSLDNIGCEYELLVWDNGSSDESLKAYIQDTLKPAYLRLYETNLGYAPAVNQLLLRAKGEYLCVLDPDIKMPGGWGQRLIEAHQAIPESGLSSFHCVLDLPPERVHNGIKIHPRHEVYGAKFFHRSLIERLGYFCEEFRPYGNEDVEMNMRCSRSGLMNYYVTGGKAIHVGDDCGDKTPYRQMKWDCLKVAHETLCRRVAFFDSGGSLYVPAPELL